VNGFGTLLDQNGELARQIAARSAAGVSLLQTTWMARCAAWAAPWLGEALPG
jgi:hypothetical protein